MLAIGPEDEVGRFEIPVSQSIAWSGPAALVWRTDDLSPPAAAFLHR